MSKPLLSLEHKRTELYDKQNKILCSGGDSEPNKYKDETSIFTYNKRDVGWFRKTGKQIVTASVGISSHFPRLVNRVGLTPHASGASIDQTGVFTFNNQDIGKYRAWKQGDNELNKSKSSILGSQTETSARKGSGLIRGKEQENLESPREEHGSPQRVVDRKEIAKPKRRREKKKQKKLVDTATNTEYINLNREGESRKINILPLEVADNSLNSGPVPKRRRTSKSPLELTTKLETAGNQRKSSKSPPRLPSNKKDLGYSRPGITNTSQTRPPKKQEKENEFRKTKKKTTKPSPIPASSSDETAIIHQKLNSVYNKYIAEKHVRSLSDVKNKQAVLLRGKELILAAGKCEVSPASTMTRRKPKPKLKSIKIQAILPESSKNKHACIKRDDKKFLITPPSKFSENVQNALLHLSEQLSSRLQQSFVNIDDICRRVHRCFTGTSVDDQKSETTSTSDVTKVNQDDEPKGLYTVLPAGSGFAGGAYYENGAPKDIKTNELPIQDNVDKNIIARKTSKYKVEKKSTGLGVDFGENRKIQTK